MKILWICCVWPECDATAAGFHTRQRMEALRAHGHELFVCSPCRPNEHQEQLAAAGISTRRFQSNDNTFDGYLDELVPDVVIFDRFMTEEQFGWRVKARCDAALRVLDTIDLHSLRRARQRIVETEDGFLARELTDAELQSDDAVREVAAIYRCDLSLIISNVEMALLIERYRVPPALLAMSRFSYTLRATTPTFAERRHFVAIGNFNHAPNLDSVRVLRRGLWAKIRTALAAQDVHDAELHVYGAYPMKEVAGFDDAASGFRIKGWCGDAHTTLARYRVNLAPLRFGAGIKGKVADGWAAGTPCVGTSIAAEGMQVGAAFGGEICDDAAQFVDRAAHLYCDQIAWQTASTQGHELLASLFDAAGNTQSFVSDIVRAYESREQRRSENFIGSMLWHHQHRSTEFMSRWIEAKNRLAVERAKLQATTPESNMRRPMIETGDMMTTMEVGKRLVELCKQGKNMEVVNSLHAEDIVSVEAFPAPGTNNRETKGIAAIKAKNEWWTSNHEIHSSQVEGPWPHDDKFIVRFSYDITNKPSGQRFKMEEAALYWVKNGKIVREEFFYSGM